MTEAELHAQTTAAGAYEDLFVPALFSEWAPRVIEAAGLRPGQRVLDVACGTGILARVAASRVAPNGAVTGIDPNPGMLAVAERLAPGVTWRRGTAEWLPFPDQSFDAVVSQFGWMFFRDRRVALQESLRVLVCGGRLSVAVWDSLENNPAYAALVALLLRVAGERAADALRMPFALGNREHLTALFADAGVGALTAATDRGVGRFPSVRAMVEAELRGWLPVVGVFLPEETVAQLLDESESVLRPYVATDGTVVFDVSAHIMTATKP